MVNQHIGKTLNDALSHGFLLYPHMTQLDVTGPAQILGYMSGAELYFVWKSFEPVPTDASFSIVRLRPSMIVLRWT